MSPVGRRHISVLPNEGVEFGHDRRREREREREARARYAIARCSRGESARSAASEWVTITVPSFPLDLFRLHSCNGFLYSPRNREAGTRHGNRTAHIRLHGLCCQEHLCVMTKSLLFRPLIAFHDFTSLSKNHSFVSKKLMFLFTLVYVQKQVCFLFSQGKEAEARSAP